MALKIFDKFAPFANPADGDYPYGSIKNDTTIGAEDGTPLDATWGNDYVGFDAALLAAAGITPNGLADTVSNSQRMQALQTLINRQAIGNGQTWQDVGATRAVNTNYTNNTGRSIVVNISFTSESFAELFVGGVVVGRFRGNFPDVNPNDGSVSAIIPNGTIYNLQATTGTFYAWSELR